MTLREKIADALRQALDKNEEFRALQKHYIRDILAFYSARTRERERKMVTIDAGVALFNDFLISEIPKVINGLALTGEEVTILKNFRYDSEQRSYFGIDGLVQHALTTCHLSQFFCTFDFKSETDREICEKFTEIRKHDPESSAEALINHINERKPKYWDFIKKAWQKTFQPNMLMAQRQNYSFLEYFCGWPAPLHPIIKFIYLLFFPVWMFNIAKNLFKIPTEFLVTAIAESFRYLRETHEPNTMTSRIFQGLQIFFELIRWAIRVCISPLANAREVFDDYHWALAILSFIASIIVIFAVFPLLLAPYVATWYGPDHLLTILNEGITRDARLANLLAFTNWTANMLGVTLSPTMAAGNLYASLLILATLLCRTPFEMIAYVTRLEIEKERRIGICDQNHWPYTPESIWFDDTSRFELGYKPKPVKKAYQAAVAELAYEIVSLLPPEKGEEPDSAAEMARVAVMRSNGTGMAAEAVAALLGRNGSGLFVPATPTPRTATQLNGRLGLIPSFLDELN